MTTPTTEQRQLLQPFPQRVVKQVNMGSYTADFVSWTDKLQRLYQLQVPWSWEVLTTAASGDQKEPVACHGRLTVTVDGQQRVLDGVGQGRDAKTASTDAFSRACAFLGLGLHLWCQGGEKDGGFWIAGALDSAADPDTGEVPDATLEEA